MSGRAGQDRSAGATGLNPARTLLLFIVGMAVIIVFPVWVGGTGGLHPADYDDEDPMPSRVVTVGLIRYTSLKPALWLTAAALIAAVACAGWRNAESGLHYAVGLGQPSRIPGAARFWTIAARVAAWGGLAYGLAAYGYVVLLIHRVHHLGHAMHFDLYHERFWGWTVCVMGAPLAGVLVGRFIMGALAEGARIRADEARSEPVFSRTHDVMLAVGFVLPWYLLTSLIWGG